MSAGGTRMLRVGVLGGMGPLATVDFLDKLVRATPAGREADHLPISVDSTPQIPDRIAAFEGRGESPLPMLRAALERLLGAGAEIVAMPCNTAHLWHAPLQAACPVPFLHIADAARDAVAAVLPAGAPVGLLATTATLASGLYRDRIAPRHPCVVPAPAVQAGEVARGIAAVKAGTIDAAAAEFERAARHLYARGAQAIVMACTEVPVGLAGVSLPLPRIDPTLALAQAVVRRAWCIAPLAGA